jgi:hypothetical protein
MPNHSTKKKRGASSSITIDEKHTQMLNEFYTIENETIPELEHTRISLKNQLHAIDENDIDQKMEIKDKIKDAGEQLKKYRSMKNDYLLNNASYIFNYFEEKKKISAGGESGNKNILNSFFKIKSELSNVSASPKYQNAKNFYQNYWTNVSKDYVNMWDAPVAVDLCHKCGTGELIPQEDEGIMICNNKQCGTYIQYIVDNEKPVYKEPPNEVTYNAYVRLNHFKEILSQFQAKETTQIPTHVIEAIRSRIKKERIQDLVNEINYEKMREILKKLGFNRYFEHIQYINSIFGIKPPVMSDELQDTLCILFIEIQEPWAIHCPIYRTNFFNCTYTLFQLCVLLNQTQYLPYIPMMKDREKQLEQDMVWKKVCDTLDWEFVPTV